MTTRTEDSIRKRLLKGMPYEESQLEALGIRDLRVLASLIGVDSWRKKKDNLIQQILEHQHELDLIDERIEPFCEMCGRFVAIREKAHIVSEKNRARVNILMLCPSCHRMLDTRLKPRLYEALRNYGTKNIPQSWKDSIYHQAFEASLRKKQ